MKYYHVDVFSKKPMGGNGCTVFLNALNSNYSLQKITQEVKQFESIFLDSISSKKIVAKIFTEQEELPFAGHPLLAAGAVVLKEYNLSEIVFKLKEKDVKVSIQKVNDTFKATLNQGNVLFGEVLSVDKISDILDLTGVSQSLDLSSPIQVVSTGLPYLIIPVKDLTQIKYQGDVTELLQKHGAHFIYFFDVSKMEGRSFDNDGKTEDVATGSAAGPAGAWLFKNGLCKENCIIHQGSFLGRASQIEVFIKEKKEDLEVDICGYVSFFSQGTLLIN